MSSGWRLIMAKHFTGLVARARYTGRTRATRPRREFRGPAPPLESSEDESRGGAAVRQRPDSRGGRQRRQRSAELRLDRR